MKRVAIASVVAVLLAGALTTQTVKTFYDDTHYSLTYYMARSCGYTPYQAHRLASADVSIDYSPLTEPVQSELQLSRGNELAQEPRVRFHAFVDDRASADAAVRSVDTHRRELEALEKQSGNPGVFLHFLQDIEPHKGYSSLGGHWVSPTAAASNLLIGATTDYLSYRPNRAYDMVDATLELLTRFLRTEIPAQRARTCARGQIGPVMSKLLVASPVPARLQVEPGSVLEQVARMARQYVRDESPDVSRANLAVATALAAEGDLRAFPDARIEYIYDARGRVAGLAAGSPNPVYGSLENLVSGPLDSFTLAGILRVRIAGATPAQVSIWAAPTRESEVPYQLTCNPSPAATLDFENMPVGDLIVQTVTTGGTISRQQVLLNRVRQDLVINLQPDTEDTKTCSKNAVQTAQQMCPATGAPGLPQNQLAAMESRMPTEVAESLGCQARATPTRTQALSPGPPAPPVPPASQPQKKGGSTTKKVLTGVAVAAGAAAGGYALADAIDKASNGGSTTSGGTTSGGGTSSTRCSTLNCIVNALGSNGSCGCSGTSSQVCPTKSIQTQINGACFNNGMYCAEGLSCNNNRCEPNFSQGGRCRF